MLSVAAVVSAGDATRRAGGRPRVVGALLTIGSATTAPQRHGLSRWSSAPTHDDTPSDGLLAQLEDALADELERAEAATLPAPRLGLLRTHLLDVRAARERRRLAVAVERSEASSGGRQGRPTSGAPAGAPVGAPAGATMAGVPLRRLAQAVRWASPGVLGLLVNAVA